MPDIVVIAATDGAAAATQAAAIAPRTAIWVGEAGTAAYEEFVAELNRRAGSPKTETPTAGTPRAGTPKRETPAGTREAGR